MKTELKLAAEPRDTRGKNEARRLRARGLTPAVVYGAGTDPIPVAVNPKEVNRILHTQSGHNTIFDIDVNGVTAPVMIVDWQFDPIKTRLLHVDLQRIDMTKRMRVKVQVATVGDPRGVKEQGGLHEVVTREVEIECLPNEIPDQFTVDVSALMLNQGVRAADLQLGGSMKLLTPPETIISHVVTTRAEVAAETAVAAAPVEAAQPEVIKKGKKEEEGAAEEKPAAKKKQS
ncbi:MAG TPA: 50S ribosomal protein L25 [Bryobacteraceae bacterium]|nr:50S ribosomal protein L25 [Bryobacteraceae bacterium]